MKQRRRKKRIDDRGMTLVELLVAIVILAIIVVPLLHTFLSSARANQQARRLLRVTTAAQDIMEGLKADSIEELAYQFNYPAGNAANGLDGFHLISESLINRGGAMADGVHEVRAQITASDRSVSGFVTTAGQEEKFGSLDPAEADQAPSVVSKDGGATYSFLPKNDGKYYFALQNMNIENTGDPNFVVDALIAVDATAYRAPDEASATAATHNTNEIVDISDMNNQSDAFYVQEEVLLKEAVQSINALHNPAPAVTQKDLQQMIELTTTEIPGGALGDAGRIQVKITVTYRTLGTPSYEYKKTEDIFDNIATGQALKNVFLFYQPLYHEAGEAAAKRDIIIYNNEDSVPATLQVARQELSDNTYLASYESGYRCDLKINEPEISDRADSVTKLRTNLDTNLYAVYDPSFSAPNQATYYYNAYSTTDRESFLAAPIYGEKDEDRVFDVTIDLYEEGTLAKAFASGTISPEDRLISISGSKN
ncbi:MAG: type II secretion system protein [Lachnospiraceae bacterium]